MGTAPPDILLIVADQLAAPALPAYGHPVVSAPHLSALAAGGVVFENAYCNSPLCAPSRASMMTGQLPSRIGAYDNAAAFPAETPTFAHYLRDAGYHTVLAGKMHFIGPDQLHGFEERLTTDIYPTDFGWTPDWERPHHRPSWYHNMLSVVQAGDCQTSNQLDFDEEVAYQANRKLFDFARQPGRRPFLLTVSFTHPHDPFAITQPYWDRYDEHAIDLPAVPPIPYEQLDPHSQRLYHVCGLGEYEQTEQRVRAARRAYYGEISYVDDKVGQLLHTLAAAGLSENTIVIFLSDHGEMLGERGLWYKMSFFEWSARVPLIVHAPNRFQPRRIRPPVSLVDLLPTLLELAGHPAPAALADRCDGRSLLPLLQGAEDARPATVLAEMLGEGAIAPLLMIRRGRFKYMFSPPDPELLFDLDADPHELDNLAAKPECAHTCQQFRAEVHQRWDVETLHSQVIASQRRRRLVAQALLQGRRSAWDFQPFTDATQQYMRGHLDLNVLERRARFPTPDTPAPDGPRSSTSGRS